MIKPKVTKVPRADERHNAALSCGQYWSLLLPIPIIAIKQVLSLQSRRKFSGPGILTALVIYFCYMDTCTHFPPNSPPIQVAT